MLQNNVLHSPIVKREYAPWRHKLFISFVISVKLW